MTRTLNLQIRPDEGDVWCLRSWWDNPNEAQTRRFELPDIDRLLETTRLYYDGAFGADLGRVGKRLYEWLDGGERWLAGALEGVRHDAQVLVLAIDVDQRLAYLPWETMNDGKGLLVQNANPRVAIARWTDGPQGSPAPQNRPLQILFMASSPEGVVPELDFENEEALILKAGTHAEAEVTVEESGSLRALRILVNDHPEGFFDVFHLTGHAEHGDSGPRFLLEDAEGAAALATAAEIVGALPRRPRLAFLSGCRTGQGNAANDVRSMAEETMRLGIRSVLGWGQPVFDTNATRAAELLYESLSNGADLATAVADTVGRLVEERVPHWHLFRWFQVGDLPEAYVTPLSQAHRKSPERRLPETEFLDPKTRKVKVAPREGFVGHRRLLQRSVRELRSPAGEAVGIQLSGFMGRGKSSVAARLCDRLCDRLSRNHERVVVFGALDETKLLQTLFAPLDDQGQQDLWTYASNRDYPLTARLGKLLRVLREDGALPRLFVLDDFEQNQPDVAQGSDRLEPEAARVLGALIEAVRAYRRDRVLLTGRYALPEPFASALPERRVEPLSEGGQLKLLRRLQAGKPETERVAGDRLRAIQDVAEGNPRLFRTLVSVALEEDVEFDALMKRLHEEEDEFRNQSAAKALVAALSPSAKALLAAMPMFEIPVPADVLFALGLANRGSMEEDIRRTCAFALMDAYREEGGVPSFLASSLVTGLVPEPEAAERKRQAGAALEALVTIWKPEKGITDDQAFALAVLARYAEDQVWLNSFVGHWASASRHRWTLRLYLRFPSAFEDDSLRLQWLSEALRNAGMGREADAAMTQARGIGMEDEGDRAKMDYRRATALVQRGDYEEALRILLEIIPVFTRSEDFRSAAVAQRQVVDVLFGRGEYAEALRILQGECLPAFERVGDAGQTAATWSGIADVLFQRGDYDEALRIRREECLPVYARLGDVRSMIVCRAMIAQTIVAQGNVERDGQEIVSHLVWAYREVKKRGLPEAGQVAGLMRQLGLPDTFVDGL